MHLLDTTHAGDLAVDETHVFYLEPMTGNVRTLPKAGGAPITLASQQRSPMRIAVDGQSVYWTNNLSGAVMKVDKQGGTPTVVSTATRPYGLALAGAHVYFTASPDGVVRLMKAPKEGGDATIFYPTYPPPANPVLSTVSIAEEIQSNGRFVAVRDLRSGSLVRILDVLDGNTPVAEHAPMLGLALGPDYVVSSDGVNFKHLSWYNLLPRGASPEPGRDVSGARVDGRSDQRFSADRCAAYGFTYRLVAFPPGSVPISFRHDDPIARLVSDGRYLYWSGPSGLWRSPIP